MSQDINIVAACNKHKEGNRADNVAHKVTEREGKRDQVYSTEIDAEY